MSGRSAYVRKEKTKTKTKLRDSSCPTSSDAVNKPIADKAYGDLPTPPTTTTTTSTTTTSRHVPQYVADLPFRSPNNEIATIETNISTGSDDLAYARVRKPHVPVIDVSGIEKSSFRTAMDKKSEEARKGLSSLFRKKTRKGDDRKGGEQAAYDHRPTTAMTASLSTESCEIEGADLSPPPPPSRRTQKATDAPPFLPPPPSKLSAGPPAQGQQLRRWLGSGRPVQPWNKLRKDPELWDPNGDTLVFFGQEGQSLRGSPSFRLSSHVLEQTESRFLVTLLREGSIDDGNSFSMPPSPLGSPGTRPNYLGHGGRSRHPTPPMSDSGISGNLSDGQISYEIFFPVPRDATKTEILRHQITTRNVFALLYQASLVGLDLYQVLDDLHQRLELYMPDERDAASMIIDYIVSKGIDDVRENPAAAAALLAWSENSHVHWEEGWREAYVHSCGMFYRLETSPEFHNITPITKALLERASLEVHERIQSCETRFTDFDFGDMWPVMSPHPPPSRTAFERLRDFFYQHYQTTYGQWPPAEREGLEQWLTRGLAQKLQNDFGALYDYLVDREVAWDHSEERHGRKWNIVHPNNRSFDVDTDDLPLTDILVAFDNRHKYPHIPHPYPLVPEITSSRKESRENLFKSSKKSNKPAEDKMAERKAALAYTESTNIYLLGSEFVNNDLVDAFVRFEKGDRAGDVDPYAARRGRWVLIYAILQTLASVAVDTPHLRYSADVSYHLNPRLRGTPPWKGAKQNVVEASHAGSHCWTIRDTWHPATPVMAARKVSSTLSLRPSAPSASSSSETGSSTRSRPSISGRSSSGRRGHKSNESFGGGSPGNDRLSPRPIKEESGEYFSRIDYGFRSGGQNEGGGLFPSPPNEDRATNTLKKRERKDPFSSPPPVQKGLVIKEGLVVKDFDDCRSWGRL